MTIIKKLDKYYEGLSTDPKPTGAISGSVFRETDTQTIYTSYDGATWVVSDERVRLTNEDGTFIDLPGEFDSLEAAITG